MNSNPSQEDSNPSQEDKILDFLQAQLDQWVPMPHLWSISGSMACHSRIAALRKRGCNIINKVERAEDGTKHSFYKLLAP